MFAGNRRRRAVYAKKRWNHRLRQKDWINHPIECRVRPWAILLNGWTQDAKNNLDKFVVPLPLLCQIKRLIPVPRSPLRDSQVWLYVCPACADGTLRQWIEGQQVKAMECTPVCQVLLKRIVEGAPRRAIDENED